MLKWIILFLYPTCLWATAPQATDTIDFTHVQVDYLSHLVKIKVDSLREKQGLQPLQTDPILQSAANDHVHYLAENAVNSHYQPYPHKTDVLKRVVYYGGHHLVKVGENVLWKRPARHRIWDNKQQRYNAHYYYTYNTMANAIVRAWVQSPSHWATLQIPTFSGTGIAIHVDETTKIIRAVQVFAQYTAH